MKLMMKVDGVSKAISRLELVRPSVQAEIKGTMHRTVLMIAGRAQEIITEKGHVVTGNLRRSIQGKSGMVSQYEVHGTVGTDVPYAPFIEALPDGGYLFQAYKEKMKEAENYLIVGIRQIIRRLA